MLLNAEELGELMSLAVQSGLLYHRDLLLEGFPKIIRDELPLKKDPIEQLRSDLEILNRIPATEPELPAAPLEIWIRNAIGFLQGAPEQALLYTLSQHLIERRPHKTKSAPPPPAYMPTKGFYFWGGDDRFLDTFERVRSLIDPDRSAGDEPETPPRRDTGEISAPQTPERFVNIGLSAKAEPTQFCPKDRCLDPASAYYCWLEIGALLEQGDTHDKPAKFPAELLPDEAMLTVVLFTNPNGFELNPEADLGKLLLNKDGTVTVARRACTPEGMKESDPLLERRLFFPIKTPAKEGEYFLRVSIYYENALVQSHQMRMKIGVNTYTRQAVYTETDYTLSRSLRKSAMDFLRGHQLSIFMNESEDGTHGFRFLGGGDYHKSVFLNDGEVTNLIQMLRNTLKKACWDEEADWTPQQDQSYRYENSGDFDLLQRDLVNMAIAGHRAYDMIADQLGADFEEIDKLKAQMRRPGQLQFALKQSVRLYLPIALFYDHALDSWLDPKEFSLCNAFKEAAAQHDHGLEAAACFQGDCPNRDNDRIVCPGGFWGFRHALGLPLTLEGEEQHSLDLEYPLPADTPPSMTVSVCDTPDLEHVQSHIEKIQSLIPAGQLGLAKTRDSTIELLKQRSSHLVYFYCHGGVSGTVPFLQIGPSKSDRIGRDTLREKRISWKKPRSLVFINGCHTTDLEPERAIDLVSGFVRTAQASGVIGTEITIFEPLAVSFSQWFFQFFLKEQKSVGESIRLARLRVLQRELNPLGLVYIPFAASTLKISSSASASQ